MRTIAIFLYCTLILSTLSATPPPAIQTCPGAYYPYCVAETPDAVSYEWQLPAGFSINGMSGTVTLPAPDGHCATLACGTTSGTLIVTPILSNSQTGAVTTQQFIISPIPPTVLPYLVLNTNNLPFLWGEYSTVLEQPGLYRLSQTLTSWVGCDSVVKQTILVVEALDDISSCPGGLFHECLPPIPDATGFIVNVPPGTMINGAPGPRSFPIANACFDLTFGSGSGEVVVTAHMNSGADLLIYDQTVTIGTPAAIVLPPLTITSDLLPYHWWVAPAQILLQTGSAMLTAHFTSSTGCDSTVEQLVIVVQQNAQVLAHGRVFTDNNANGIFEPNLGEQPINGAAIQYNGSFLANTGVDGGYTLLDPVAGTTITLNMPGFSAVPDHYTFQPTMLNGYDFSVNTRDLKVFTYNTNPFRINTITYMYCVFGNNSLQPEQNVSGMVILPAQLEYLTAFPLPASISGDTLFWNFGQIEKNSNKTVALQVKTKIGTSISAIMPIQSWIKPVEHDLAPANNHYFQNGIVAGAFDPNQKSVWPLFVAPESAADTRLEYTVYFQNTGNDTAFLVRVRDTLSDQLDWGSFHLSGSSHPCQFGFPGPNVVEFLCPDIKLPDMHTDDAGSHGFIKFTIQPKGGLSGGDVLENAADIYFDANQPVRTNTANTLVVGSGSGLALNQSGMLAIPNPASDHVFFQWKKPNAVAGILRIFTAEGNEVLTMPLEAGQKSASIQPLGIPSGSYIAVMEAGDVRKVQRFVVVRNTGEKNK